MSESITAGPPRPARRVRDQVQLIAYADRLGGSLPALTRLLDGPLAGLFGGVHLLPFFLPYDGADAGFDPVDHLTVDPRLGGWPDVRRLGGSLDVVADVIVNHISDRSRPVRDVVERGQESPYAGMLLTYDRVFPAGAIEDDLTRIVRPRPGLRFTPLVLGGRRRLLWTTFTSQQIDLDVQHPAARRYLSQVLHRLADSGVAMVRLDAVGYAVKTAGSSCFLTPETMRFVAALTAEARRLGMEVLAEVHAHRRYATETATQVDRVYDFVLAPLILHGLFTGDSAPLHRWLLDRPGNCVTVLETHDGIGLLDAGPGPRPGDAGLLSPSQLEALVSTVHRNSGRPAPPARCPAAVSISSVAPPTTRWAATIGATCWPGSCSCSSRAYRRCTTSGCWPAAIRPAGRVPGTRGRSTAGRTRAPSWARRCGSPSFRRCCGSSACATPIRPSAVPSPFPPSRRASCAWRGTPTAHGPNCGRGWPTPPTG